MNKLQRELREIEKEIPRAAQHVRNMGAHMQAALDALNARADAIRAELAQ